LDEELVEVLGEKAPRSFYIVRPHPSYSQLAIDRLFPGPGKRSPAPRRPYIDDLRRDPHLLQDGNKLVRARHEQLVLTVHQLEEPYRLVRRRDRQLVDNYAAPGRALKLLNERHNLGHEVRHVGGKENVALDAFRLHPSALDRARVGYTRFFGRCTELGHHPGRRFDVDYLPAAACHGEAIAPGTTADVHQDVIRTEKGSQPLKEGVEFTPRVRPKARGDGAPGVRLRAAGAPVLSLASGDHFVVSAGGRPSELNAVSGVRFHED
jgi:hypothetical protein